MDISTVVGLILGFGALILAFVMEGGTVYALIKDTAAMIVFGGTIGAVMISYPLKDIISIPRLIKEAFVTNKSNVENIINTFVKLAETARKEGLLSLESIIEDENNKFDPFIKKGIRLVVDGVELELTKNILETEMYLMEQKHKHEAGIFEAAGGFSPTMGIIGTVMGLVHVLGNMKDPDNLGSAIAVAFIATLYGVSAANLFWLPIANKLKNKAKQLKLEKQLIIEGVLSIQAGENPRIIEEKLRIFLNEQIKKEKDNKKVATAEV